MAKKPFDPELKWHRYPDEVGLDWNNPSDRKQIGKIFLEIQKKCKYADKAVAAWRTSQKRGGDPLDEENKPKAARTTTITSPGSKGIQTL